MPKNCDVRRQVKGLNTGAVEWSQPSCGGGFSVPLYPQGLLPLRGPLGTKLGFKLSEWLDANRGKMWKLLKKWMKMAKLRFNFFQVIYVIYVYIYIRIYNSSLSLNIIPGFTDQAHSVDSHGFPSRQNLKHRRCCRLLGLGEQSWVPSYN